MTVKIGDVVTIVVNGDTGAWYQGFPVGCKVVVEGVQGDGVVEARGEFPDNYSQTLHPSHYKVDAAKEARVKYLYSVETADGETQIMSTRDREYARQVKSYCGGKKEGVVIMAYAPVKEIR